MHSSGVKAQSFNNSQQDPAQESEVLQFLTPSTRVGMGDLYNFKLSWLHAGYVGTEGSKK